MPQIKCDLHIHTEASADGHCPVTAIIDMAKKRGFDAIAITDHDTTTGAKEAIALENPGILIIPGIEVSTKSGHVLVLGTTKEYEPGKSAAETIREAKEDGCLVIIPHPYHLFRHAVGLHEEDALSMADALEAYNSRYYFNTSNEAAAKKAKELNKPITAGSDAHECEFVGNGINLIDAEERSIDSIFKSIKEGKIKATCVKTPSKTYALESANNVKRKIKKYAGKLLSHKRS